MLSIQGYVGDSVETSTSPSPGLQKLRMFSIQEFVGDGLISRVDFVETRTLPKVSAKLSMPFSVLSRRGRGRGLSEERISIGRL
jgi:hypothetical protein